MKRGKTPAVLAVKVPATVSVAADAVLHYEAFFKTSGFHHLQNQAVLKLMLTNHAYDWPAYAVDEVGFKLSKRGERVRVNQLCTFFDALGDEKPNVHKADTAVTPVVNVVSPVKVLDYLRRDVTWL